MLGLAVGTVRAAGERAKNVILFLGDAGGISTLNAAGIYAHNKPQSLFIQSLPHVALSDTSALDAWVTDSAAEEWHRSGGGIGEGGLQNV